MDRTKQKFGKADINILTISISLAGTAICCWWSGKLSCLDEKQKARIRCLLMDRKFGAADWLQSLQKRNIHFVVRIRKEAKVRILGTRPRPGACSARHPSGRYAKEGSSSATACTSPGSA